MNKIKVFAAVLALSVMATGCTATTTAVVSTTAAESKTNDTADAEVDDYEEDINLDECSDNVEITKSGEYTLSGTLTDHYIHINTQNAVILHLNGVTITNKSGPAIYAESGALTIDLVSGQTNTLTDGSEYDNEDIKAAVYSKDDLTFTGEGSLSVNGSYNHAISSKGTIIVEDGTYTLQAAKDGIHSNGDIVIQKGTFDINAEDDCIQSEQNLLINDGEFNLVSVNKGIRAETDLALNKGTYNITASSEGIESKDALTINGGTYDLKCDNDCINASNSLVINDGTIKAISYTNDAIDSNGTITFNGGDVVAYGLTTPEGSYDCDNNTFTITEGRFIGIGSTHSQPTESDQNTLIIAPETTDAIQNVTIKTTDGEEVFSYDFDDYSSYTKQSFGGGDMKDKGDFSGNKDDKNFSKDDSNGEMQKPDNDSEGNEPDEAGQQPSFDGEAPDMSQNSEGFDPDSSHNSEDFGGEMPQNSEMPQMPSSEDGDNTGFDFSEMFNKLSKDFGGGSFGSSSANIFISVPELATGNEYEIYINGELVDTVTIDSYVTTVGNVSTMGGGFGGGGFGGFGKNK